MARNETRRKRKRRRKCSNKTKNQRLFLFSISMLLLCVAVPVLNKKRVRFICFSRLFTSIILYGFCFVTLCTEFKSWNYLGEKCEFKNAWHALMCVRCTMYDIILSLLYEIVALSNAYFCRVGSLLVRTFDIDSLHFWRKWIIRASNVLNELLIEFVYQISKQMASSFQ